MLDFGLAKLVRQFRDEVDNEAPPGRHTVSGAVVGTAHYSLPNNAGEVLDSRTDVSLGVVLYEAATRSCRSWSKLLVISTPLRQRFRRRPAHAPGPIVEFDLIIERALAKREP